MHIRLAFLFLLVAGSAGATTLPEAVLAENDSLIVALLDSGAGIDETLPTYYGATALMIAAGNDDVKLVQLFLDAGARPDARDKNGDTALNWAAYSGCVEAARLLLAAGADPSLSGHGNALQIALRRGHEELVQVLGRNRHLWIEPDDVVARVISAIIRDDPIALQRALANCGCPDVRDEMDRPILHLAARLGHREALQVLLAAGSAVDAVDLNGFTALMVAAREGNADLVADLLAAGADVLHAAEPHALGLRPIHLAAIGGKPIIIEAFAAAGADLNSPDTDANVPMLWALADGGIEAVLTLIELGADPDLENKDGDSVASMARKYDITPLLEVLDSKDSR